MEHEGETQSPPGPKPKGLRGWTKSELGKDLGVHKIGVSEVSRVKCSKIAILVLRYNEYKMAP